MGNQAVSRAPDAQNVRTVHPRRGPDGGHTPEGVVLSSDEGLGVVVDDGFRERPLAGPYTACGRGLRPPCKKKVLRGIPGLMP